MIGKVIRGFLPKKDLLPYVEAILRVYNLSGRRDNKYKARIKILVHETGIDELKTRVESEFASRKRAFPGVEPKLLSAIQGSFAPPDYLDPDQADHFRRFGADEAFRTWCETNTARHKNPDYAIVTISMKPVGGTPGDATADQMRTIAELAERYCHDEIRVSHEQNIILPHVPRAFLSAIYDRLGPVGLATANVGLISDIIACPGMDYCALATARSIPIAQEISRRIDELRLERSIGPLKVKISGCINACGHHHVGHIGILGLDRAGVENYQVTLGGDATENAAIGRRVGPGFSADELIPAIERLLSAYLDIRLSDQEPFIDCFRRSGDAPFKAALYPEDMHRAALGATG